MSKFSKSLGSIFEMNKNQLRIRKFVFNGHTFRVKIPLTSEADLIAKRLENIDEERVAKVYAEMSEAFIKNKESFLQDESLEIEYQDDDIIVKGRSLSETARNKILTEQRVVEMFKLIVPEEIGFDMEDLTYEMIEELFPFAIQMQMMQLISDTISPSYTEAKGK